MTRPDDSLLTLVARIVSAQVANHDTGANALPGLIRDVYLALACIDPRGTQTPATPLAARRAAAGQSVFDDHLVCMECGLHMKMLKRHLQTVHHMTPAQYRTRFGLAGDYPMVARQYAELRSTLAKGSGLGKRGGPRVR